MLFSPRIIIFGAAALLSTIAAAGDCDTGPWNSNKTMLIGGRSGSPYCMTKYQTGIMITGVEVWASKHRVEAIQFYYSDGTNSDQLGMAKNTVQHARMDWDSSKEQLSQVKSWGNGEGTSYGRIYLRTTAGRELDVGKNTNGQVTYEPDVQSGFLLGAYGHYSEGINSLGLLFLRSKINTISMMDVQMKDSPSELNMRMQGLQTVTLDYADHTNAQVNSTETFSFGRSETRSTAKTYASTASQTFGINEAFQVSGKLMGIAVSETTTLTYSYTMSSYEESTTKEDVTVFYTVAAILAPGQRVYCQATAMMGEYKGLFSTTINILLEDTTSYQFKTHGEMAQVSWSQASSKCQGTPFSPSSQFPLAPAAKRSISFTA